MPADRPALSRERVVAEAVALADEQGLPALSMRALAGRLGVEAMSLYHHVRGKDALLDAMVDAVFAEMHLPRADGDWRGELRRRSVSGRRVLRRHRWAVGLMDSRRTPGPATIAHHDAVIGCLLAGGFTIPATGTAFAILDAHLYGFLLQENALPFETGDELAEIGAEILVPEVREAYPHFTAFAETHALRPGYAFGNEFEPGLDLVLDAVAVLRDEPVAAQPFPAEARALPPVEAKAPPPVEVTAPVLGVDGCPGGWVGAVLAPGAPRPRVVVAPTIAELVETVRADLDVLVVGVDIPIGLPDSTVRQADVLARKELRGRASSVFTTPTRPAYLEATRAAADAVNRGLSGQGVGAQAFALRAKVLEVDAWLRTRPSVDVIEVHPEVSFATMTGAALPGKRTPEGRAARLEALAAAGVARPSVLTGSGYAADDVLDACAVAWSAARRAAGLSRSLPEVPEVFSDGVRAAIHV
jgi:predicted RNase H-like nuclease/AcrR family transcriptional regulator